MLEFFSKILNRIRNIITFLFNKDITKINHNLGKDNMKKINFNDLNLIGMSKKIKLKDSYTKAEITYFWNKKHSNEFSLFLKVFKK